MTREELATVLARACNGDKYGDRYCPYGGIETYTTSHSDPNTECPFKKSGTYPDNGCDDITPQHWLDAEFSEYSQINMIVFYGIGSLHGQYPTLDQANVSTDYGGTMVDLSQKCLTAGPVFGLIEDGEEHKEESK